METDGKLRAGGVDQAGKVVVYDDGTRRELDTAIVNDHCTPCILAPSDKPPIVAWTQHNNTSNVHYKIGTVNNDLTTLGATTTTAFASGTTYAQLYRNPGTNKLLLITRLANGGAADLWVYKVSTDYGSTWSAATTLIDFAGTAGYLATAQDGTTLHCACIAGNPSVSTDPHTIHYFKINLDTGAITTRDGTGIGNLDGTSLPLVVGDMDLVYTPAAADEARLFDVSVAGQIAFAVFPTENNGSYYVSRWNGSAWAESALVATGASFSATAGDHYYGGMTFPNPTTGDEVILSKESAGTSTVERWERVAGTWTSTEDLAVSHTVDLARPYCPVGRSTEPEVIWHRVSMYAAHTKYVASLAGPAS